jgi:hypothetical protein
MPPRQDWLYKISQIPRMRNNPDFLTFLGIIDNVRESSVMFPAVGVFALPRLTSVITTLVLRAQGPMGLTLQMGKEFVEVAALKANPDGTPSPAQVEDLVAVGDKVRPAFIWLQMIG